MGGDGRGAAGAVAFERVASEAEPDLDRTVEAAKAGNPLAFEELVRRFRPSVASYAFALVRDRGLAEDVTQEVFLQAFRQLDTLRDPAAFRSWVYRITENAALTGRRRRGKKRTLRLEEGDAVAEPPPELFAGEEEEEPPRVSPEIEAVRASLLALPSAYVEVLEMHYGAELSCRDIAEVLDITGNNVKVRLYRARNALRHAMARRGFGPEAGNGASRGDGNGGGS